MADARITVDATVPVIDMLKPGPQELVVIRYAKSRHEMTDKEVEDAGANLAQLHRDYPQTTFVVLFGDVDVRSMPVGAGHVLVLQAAHPLDAKRWNVVREQWRRALGDDITARTVVLEPPLAVRAVRCPRCSTVCHELEQAGDEGEGP